MSRAREAGSGGQRLLVATTALAALLVPAGGHAQSQGTQPYVLAGDRVGDVATGGRNPPAG